MITPERIAEFDTALQATGGSPTATKGASRAQELRGRFGAGAELTTEVVPDEKEEGDTRNLAQKGLGLFLDPIMESGARAGQAVGALGLKGADILSGGAISRRTPEKDIDAAIERALNTPSKFPLTGSELRPQKEETIENVAGRAVSTVALGLGSPVLAGGAFGAGAAMQEDKGTTEVVITGLASAIGAKILAVGFNKAAPYITRALAKYGTPMIEKLQAQLPEYAKPALDKLIRAGQRTMTRIGQETFEEATDVLPKTTGIPFKQSRTSAWEDLAPKPTPTTRTQYAGERAISEQGKLTKAQLQPTKADEPVLGAYQKLYDEGAVTTKMSYLDKLKAIDQKAAQLHQQQKGFLAENDKAVSLISTKAEKGIFNILDDMAGTNTTVFAKDPSAKGAYDSAIDVFKNQLVSGKQAGSTKGATTLSKMDEALTAFDAEMEKFNPWSRAKTGQLTETDRARILAIRDIHTAVRDYIAKNLPKNSPWKAIRLEESYLYQAGDKIGPKLGETVNQNQTTQFFKDHPTLKRGLFWLGVTIGGGAVGGIGVGALTQ